MLTQKRDQPAEVKEARRRVATTWKDLSKHKMAEQMPQRYRLLFERAPDTIATAKATA